MGLIRADVWPIKPSRVEVDHMRPTSLVGYEYFESEDNFAYRVGHQID